MTTDTQNKKLVSNLQSMRDRMMAVLPQHFGEGFDGDMDTLLETINHLKRENAGARHED
jgi:hypothetical protein